MRTCRGFARSSGLGAVAGFAGAIVCAAVLCFGDGAAAAQKPLEATAIEARAVETGDAQTSAAEAWARPTSRRNKSHSKKKRNKTLNRSKKQNRKEAKKSKKRNKKSLKQELSKQEPLKSSGSQFEPLKWSELTGWAADDHLAAFAAYQAGCRVARRKPRSDERGLIFGALSNVCRKALALAPQDSAAARAFFEQNFQPVRVARLGEGEGLVTGYYEPVVAGSRFPSPEFSVPIYRRPRDLVADGYKQGSTAFPNKGGRIGRRTENNDLVPYHDRGAIEAGALDGQKLEILLDQGSARPGGDPDRGLGARDPRGWHAAAHQL